jgi:hypothetical protein
LTEILELLVAAGYFRARIKGLSPFDKVRENLFSHYIIRIDGMINHDRERRKRLHFYFLHFYISTLPNAESL